MRQREAVSMSAHPKLSGVFIHTQTTPGFTLRPPPTRDLTLPFALVSHSTNQYQTRISNLLEIKATLSNNGYKLPKIIWQPGSRAACQHRATPHLSRTHTVTEEARICSRLLLPPTSFRFISPKGDFLFGHGDSPPAVSALPHKLPGAIGTLTGSTALPGALGRVQARSDVSEGMCVHFRVLEVTRSRIIKSKMPPVDMKSRGMSGCLRTLGTGPLTTCIAPVLKLHSAFLHKPLS